MKKSIAAFTTLFLMFTGVFAQENINKLDSKGNRNGLWKGVYEDTKKPRYEGTFKNGKETGIFKFFENNETSTLAATRDFTAQDGSCYTILFDEKGFKISEGREINKQRTGEWKFYHPNSTAIMSTENYVKGNIHGLRKVFFPNGLIAEETNYVNGIRDGIYKKYTEKGILLEDSRYKNGKFHGRAVFRDAQGKIAGEGVFTNGLKTGIWKFYENGKLVKEVNKDEVRTARKPKQ